MLQSSPTVASRMSSASKRRPRSCWRRPASRSARRSRPDCRDVAVQATLVAQAVDEASLGQQIVEVGLVFSGHRDAQLGRGLVRTLAPRRRDRPPAPRSTARPGMRAAHRSSGRRRRTLRRGGNGRWRRSDRLRARARAVSASTSAGGGRCPSSSQRNRIAAQCCECLLHLRWGHVGRGGVSVEHPEHRVGRTVGPRRSLEQQVAHRDEGMGVEAMVLIHHLADMGAARLQVRAQLCVVERGEVDANRVRRGEPARPA